MAKPAVVVPRHAYNYDVAAVSDETGLKCEDESLTLQSQAQEADINVIVKRFNVTGVLPSGIRMPTYGDFTGVADYREALDAVNAAERSFMELPAAVRKRFDNDPAAFVDFCSDPANLEEARKLGLAVPEKVKEVLDVRLQSEVGGAAVAGAEVSGEGGEKPRARVQDEGRRGQVPGAAGPKAGR